MFLTVKTPLTEVNELGFAESWEEGEIKIMMELLSYVTMFS